MRKVIAAAGIVFLSACSRDTASMPTITTPVVIAPQISFFLYQEQADLAASAPAPGNPAPTLADPKDRIDLYKQLTRSSQRKGGLP